MLYANRKDIEKEENKHLKDIYNEVLERLEQANTSKNGFSVTFRVRLDRVIEQRTDKGLRVNTTAKQLVTYKSIVNEKIPGGRPKKVQWVYSEEPLPEEGGVADTSKMGENGHKWYFMNDHIEETITDPELAFFLYHCHSKFGEKSNNAMFYLVDENYEAKQHVSKKQTEVEFEYVLYGESSPLRDERRLTTIARAWGIRDVDDMSNDRVLTSIEKAVRKGEDRKKAGDKNARGITEFLEDTKLGYITKIMAYVTKAEEDGIIAFDNSKPSTLGVYWVDSRGEMAGKIIGLTQRSVDTWRVRMAEHLANNVNILNAIKVELGEATEEEANSAGEEVDWYDLLDNFYDDDNKSKIQEICKNFEIRTAGRKKELWREDLIRMLKDQEVIDKDYE